MIDTSTPEGRAAYVMQELAEWEALDRATRPEPRRRRKVSGPSIVFSVRLDPNEVKALEARSAAIGLKPTVLARNLIRTGLAAHNGESVARAIDRLEAALEELRAAAGAVSLPAALAAMNRLAESDGPPQHDAMPATRDACVALDP